MKKEACQRGDADAADGSIWSDFGASWSGAFDCRGKKEITGSFKFSGADGFGGNLCDFYKRLSCGAGDCACGGA